MPIKTRTIVVSVIFVLVIVGLFVGGYILYKYLSGGGNQPQPTPNPPGPQPNPGPPPGTPTLITGQTMTQDEKLYDAEKRYYLTAQSDGNFVLYDSTKNPPSAGSAVWYCCLSDFGEGPYQVSNLPNGNLVLTDVNNSIGWSSMEVFSYTPAGFPVTLFVADGAAQLVDSKQNTLWSSSPVGNLNFPKSGPYGLNSKGVQEPIQSLAYKRAGTSQNLLFEPWDWDSCIEQQWQLSFVDMFDKNSAIYTIQNMLYTTDSSSTYNLKQILYEGYTNYVAAGIDVTDTVAPNKTYQNFILRKAPNYNNSATDDLYTISPYNYPCYNIAGGHYQGQVNGYDVDFVILLQPANPLDNSQIWQIITATPTSNLCHF